MKLLKKNTQSFEKLYRPIYEYLISFLLLIFVLITIVFGLACANWSYKIILFASLLIGSLSLCFFIKGYKLSKLKSSLLGAPVQIVDIEEFKKKTSKFMNSKECWLGSGFVWTPTQTQRTYEFLNLDWNKITRSMSLIEKCKAKWKYANKLYKSKVSSVKFISFLVWIFSWFKKSPQKNVIGNPYIHSFAGKEDPISVPISRISSHLLILGSSGSGKTRLADLLNIQAIMRDEPLVIIDPKCDKLMLKNTRIACEVYRQNSIKNGRDCGNRFFFFHQSDPKASVKINFTADSISDVELRFKKFFLSEEDDSIKDRVEVNILDLLKKNCVLYVGLDSFPNGGVGALVLSEIIAAVNQLKHDNKVINILIDEGIECINDSFIQFLSKDKYAGLRVILTAKNINSFNLVLGSDVKAKMLLNHIKNVISFRVEDDDSKKFCLQNVPPAIVKTYEYSQNYNWNTSPLSYEANKCVSIQEIEVPLIHKNLFSMLADLEYIGKFEGPNIVKGKLPIITFGNKIEEK